MATSLDRRTFLKGVAAASALPLSVRLGAMAGWGATGPVPTPDRMLLVVNLGGGNDALNTVAPYTDPAYAKVRPTLGLRSTEVRPLGSGYGLHASLTFLHEQWVAGRLAVVQSVGYPNPTQSHFDSARIWETASRDGRWQTGWLGRYLDASDGTRPGLVRAVAVNSHLPLLITGERNLGLSFPALAELDFADGGTSDVALRRRAFEGFAAAASSSMLGKVAGAQVAMRGAVSTVQATPDRPAPRSAAESVAQIFSAGLGTEIAVLHLSDWDTHSNQRAVHAQRLAQLDAICKAFFTAARSYGVGDRANVLVVSEFGRRVPENGTEGSDHGAATTVLAVGPNVRGGFHGSRPNLTALQDGNLVHAVDMRSVYASVLQQLLRWPSDAVLGGTFPTAPLFA